MITALIFYIDSKYKAEAEGLYFIGFILDLIIFDTLSKLILA